MSDDNHLYAQISRSFLFPRLIFGLPAGFAIFIFFLSFEFILILRMYLVGVIVAVSSYILGRFLSKKDVFYFDIVMSIFRYKKVLK